MKNALTFFAKVVVVLIALEILLRLFYLLEVVWLKIISVLL
jgi:hypothetical protein